MCRRAQASLFGLAPRHCRSRHQPPCFAHASRQCRFLSRPPRAGLAPIGRVLRPRQSPWLLLYRSREPLPLLALTHIGAGQWQQPSRESPLVPALAVYQAPRPAAVAVAACSDFKEVQQVISITSSSHPVLLLIVEGMKITDKNKYRKLGVSISRIPKTTFLSIVSLFAHSNNQYCLLLVH